VPRASAYWFCARQVFYQKVTSAQFMFSFFRFQQTIKRNKTSARTKAWYTSLVAEQIFVQTQKLDAKIESM
jgi:hypothetical protein